MILVDSNVIIDILNRDGDWFDWSNSAILERSMDSALFINSIIAGELGWQFESYRSFEQEMATLLISVEPIVPEVGFLASVAYRRHVERRKGGPEAKRPLPDFFIGGHAQMMGASILTRDARFYRSYFPQVELITPEIQP